MNTDNETAYDYRVISVQDTTEYDPMQGQIRSKRVNYQTRDGHVSYVIVPLTEYSVEKVQQMIAAATAHHQNIISIKGNTGYTPTDFGHINPNPFGEPPKRTS